MNITVVDIERIMIDTVAGEPHDAQRLGPLIERALARLLKQAGLQSDSVRERRGAISTVNAEIPLHASDEQIANQVAETLMRVLTR